MPSKRTVRTDWVNMTELKIHHIFKGERSPTRYTSPISKDLLVSFEMRIEDREGTKNALLSLYRCHGHFEVGCHTRDRDLTTWIVCESSPSMHSKRKKALFKICISEESEKEWIQEAICAYSETDEDHSDINDSKAVTKDTPLITASVSYEKNHAAQAAPLPEPEALASPEESHHHNHDRVEEQWAEVGVKAEANNSNVEDDEWLVL